jgi:aminopeptidase N
MRRIALISIALLLCSVAARAQDLVVHHELDVRVDPATSRVDVTDTISIPVTMQLEDLAFSLHEGLSPQSVTEGTSIEEAGGTGSAADKGMDQEDYSSEIRQAQYRIVAAEGFDGRQVTIRYGGTIHHPIRQIEQEYARGFSQSPGLVDEQGVYLAGATHWIPSFGEEYVTYTMTVRTPAGWKTVSQGKRSSSSDDDDGHVDTWIVDTPTEEVFVIAAEFVEYEYAVGNILAMAFLRDQDDGLANKYLETTAQYMEMYQDLLGPYPYSKFALVENFWETGYGMPSFTLLGPQVIRFPFILHSSYPHELLHNWWGNGVFVDFDTGNWCEGLTTYMADHLIAEQRGTGDDYRRATLQGYTDYVTADNEFPLREFLSRTNASSSSIGYGKTAMIWDMLRGEVGDEAFKRAFQKFYRDNQFRRAGFDDIRAAFEDVTGRDFGAFFKQWVDRAGAPELSLHGVRSDATPDGFAVQFTLQQQQPGEAYALSVPVAIYTADAVTSETVAMTSKEQTFTIPVSGQPLRVAVDPQFNLMRRLDYREIPPSMSKMFGATRTLIILPAAAEADEMARYEALAAAWKGGQGDAFEVRLDKEVDELPADRSIWVLGWNNRWRSAIEQGLQPYDAEIGDGGVRLSTETGDPASTSLVVALRHPGNTDLAMTWVTVHDQAAVAGLARKLPHYGKYSYLGFTGDEPTNVIKGQWPAVGSPLVADLVDAPADLPALAERPALATLAPVFNATRMQADVEALAGEATRGRGIGAGDLDAAADYIAAQFRAAGLEPAGDDGTYFQVFTMTGEDGSEVTVRNVLGVIPGSNAEMAQESVIVSAHYDHLGVGGAAVPERNRGKIHFGADDNASGVAVMLELARTLGRSLEPSRSVVFAAFTAEESGLVGARHYVKNATRYPATKAIGILNIDTVGRLGDNKLLVLGAESAREWRFIFMGASYVTGVPTELPSQPLDASDQVAFVEAGVPGVQFFSGASPDYHKPTDTADKVDYRGMVRVASIVREGIEYLGERPEPLSFQGGTAAARPSGAGGGERRVATGLVPDFAHSGKGVAVSEVRAGTAAEKAGLGAGDVITSIDGNEVTDLRSYSDMLKQFAPGDVIEIVFVRDGKEHTTNLTLMER